MRFERLIDIPPLRVSYLPGDSEDLVIAFASIGRDPTREVAPEFVATALGRGTAGPLRHALFVMDDSRSWANARVFAPALHAALARVRRRASITRIATIGLSMGGFSALVAARLLPVQTVLAFGAQYSIVPGVVAGERRWAQWSEALPPVLWREAPVPAPGAGCHAWLFHGAQDDLAQARAFRPSAACDQLIFPACGHSDLLPHLKARGGLSGLVSAALDQDRRRLLRIASSAGGIRRPRFERMYPDEMAG